ncbi:MAG: hypothetical protein FWH08_03275 [Oscillospiraceae bacterium]|nr:hypothetical protein [Oscillospiraceae bacterium]
MKNILDTIYIAYAENIDSDLLKLTGEIKTRLNQKLDDESKKLLEKLIDAQNELLEYASRESFRQGFCANTLLTFEMLNR